MAGFGHSLAPRDIIRNLRHNVRELTPENIQSTVDQSRDYWDGDYGQRLQKGVCLTESDLWEPMEEKVVVGNGDFVTTNPNLRGTKQHLVAKRGHWVLFLYTLPNGKKEFSFNAQCGKLTAWHPGECRNRILHHFGQEIYDQWRALVKQDFKTQAPWLIAQARKHCSGYRAWSVTADDSSTRLLQRVPRVTVIQPGVAFLFL